MLTDQDQHLIDLFLKGELSATTQGAFDARMQDVAFRDELEYRQNLQQALRYQGRVLMKGELKAIESGGSMASRGISRNVRWLALAASVALVVTAAYFLLKNTGEKDLYAEYFQPIPNVVAPITKGSEDETGDGEAFRAYELGDYGRAELLLKSLDQRNPAVAFYSAITDMHLHKMQASEARLTTIALNPEAQYVAHAQWYLMLVEYRIGRNDRVDSLLTILTQEPAHPYHTDALSFLRKK